MEIRQDKVTWLQKLFGSPEAKKALTDIFEEGAALEKAADTAGLTYKGFPPASGDKKPTNPGPGGTEAGPAEDPTKKKDPAASPVVETKADGVPDPAMGGGGDMGMGGDMGEGETGQEYVSDMTIQELHTQLDKVINDTIQAALAPILEQLTTAASANNATKEFAGKIATDLNQVAVVLKSIVSDSAGLASRLESAEKALRELQGEQPPVVKQGLRPTAADTNIVATQTQKDATPQAGVQEFFDFLMSGPKI